jgi:regulatory protein
MAGKITALKRQKKNRERVSVFIDGRFAFGLPEIIAAHLSLGQFLSDAEIQGLTKQGDSETAYNRALDYLSYRPRSRAEVVAYLKKRDVNESQIESIVERLERASLLDDEAFAQFWVQDRERFRPRGLRALRYELRKKGLDTGTIEQALASVDPSASAYRAATKKARQWSHLDEPTFRQKLVAFLARRGFDYEVAREVTQRCWTELATGE